MSTGRLLLEKSDIHMLTLASLLVGFWFFAVMMSYTLGGFIHLLLIAAVVIALVRIIEGENPLRA